MVRADRVSGRAAARSRQHPGAGRGRRGTAPPPPESTSSGGRPGAAPYWSHPTPRSGSICGCRAVTTSGTTTSSGPPPGWGTSGWKRSRGSVSAPCASTAVRRCAEPGPNSICFAGLGPGEVHLAGPGVDGTGVGGTTVGGTGVAGNGVAGTEAPGPKVTGLAQRRTRAGARFHTSAPLAWDPVPLTPFSLSRPMSTAPSSPTGAPTGRPCRTVVGGCRRRPARPGPTVASGTSATTTSSPRWRTPSSTRCPDPGPTAGTGFPPVGVGPGRPPPRSAAPRPVVPAPWALPAVSAAPTAPRRPGAGTGRVARGGGVAGPGRAHGGGWGC